MQGNRGAADQEIITALAEGKDNGPVLLYAARVAVLGGDSGTAADRVRRALAATNPALPPHQREAARELLN